MNALACFTAGEVRSIIWTLFVAVLLLKWLAW